VRRKVIDGGFKNRNSKGPFWGGTSAGRAIRWYWALVQSRMEARVFFSSSTQSVEKGLVAAVARDCHWPPTK